MPLAVHAQGLSAGVKLPSGERMTILKDATLRVPEGGSAAIAGRSGSGKTTLLTLLGLMGRPDRGDLVLAGRPTAHISDADAAVLRNELIGFVFQSFSLIDSHDVLENVELPYTYGRRCRRRLIRQRALDMLELVGLAGFAHRRVAQLSGGEQQRVAIARALVRRPKIILADEPTGSLDIETGSHVMRILCEAAAAEGSCLIVVTHDPAVAAGLDETWELRDGSLTPPEDRAGQRAEASPVASCAEPQGSDGFLGDPDGTRP